ncbi:MAG TPA: hypothetical protein DCL80_15315 [Balneola sp.]|mgnify:CR=1 FL=1|nr:hypothetical protein [Balneola sp.]MAO78895.1 hypothetical protein [Balneola sp.]MBF63554.1 hypothetical protein [Balneola sp.]HAH52542.1 hypothetical protein [Balneola sp.]HAW81408.1 hypothetical protein [Balneola sp.]|tara:strand:- start:2614 stop:2949 length:336 start_codon:yes stop_codon:yes gene_type:complete
MSTDSIETLDVRHKTKQPTATQTPYPSVTRQALRKNPDAHQVSEELGIHIATVYRHAMGMDLKMIKAFKDLDLGIKDMVRFMKHEMKQSNASIAEKLGTTPSYVSEVLNEN